MQLFNRDCVELSFSDRGSQSVQIFSKHAACNPKRADPLFRLGIKHNDLIRGSKANRAVINKASVRGKSRKDQVKDEAISAMCTDLVVPIAHLKLGLMKHL